MRYCHPLEAREDCKLCVMYETNPSYRAMADKVSQMDIERNANSLIVTKPCGCKDCDCVDLQGHYNPSIVEYNNKIVMASRGKQGVNNNRLYISELDDNLKPTTKFELKLSHHLTGSGQEDPRLFIYQHKLHLSYTGVEISRNRIHTHQMLANLNAKYYPINIWAPIYHHRQWPKEKNWVYFEGENGELLCVYQIHPHIILDNHGTISKIVASTPTSMASKWEHGYIRGGASPYRVGGEYYHWFHGTKLTQDGPSYTLGLYTFSAQWPYQPLRWIDKPLLATEERNKANKRVIFPSGSILRDKEWIISYGYNDEEIRFVKYDALEIESKLKPID